MAEFEQPLIIGLGELLWDVLPAGKQLGGAPANFAYHTTLLGSRGVVASCVGADELGREAVERMRQLNLEISYVQLDETHPTGTVQVELDDLGQPSYRITEDVAWDFLAWTPECQSLAAQADAVCFGSLAQRSPKSRTTIRQFLQATRPDALRVFDVNLRQAFYTAETLAESLRLATIVKLNNEELPKVANALCLQCESQAVCAQHLIETYELELVCVTRGSQGSLLATRTATIEHHGLNIEVVDTIGAGDAFTAALVYHYLRGSSLREISKAANILGAWVATRAGATPQVDEEVVEQLKLITN